LKFDHIWSLARLSLNKGAKLTFLARNFLPTFIFFLLLTACEKKWTGDRAIIPEDIFSWTKMSNEDKNKIGMKLNLILDE
jgi:hypothetical protein